MQPATSITPLTAARFEHDATTPKPVGANAIVTEEVVTTLPPESSTLTTGSVVRGESAAPPTGDVVNASCVGTPGPVGEIGGLVTEIAVPCKVAIKS